MTDDPALDSGPVARLDQVAIRVGGAAVLEDVSFDVAAGEILAVIGRNGAGKSVLLRLLAGLMPATAGRIALFGRDITRHEHRFGLLPWRRDAFERLRPEIGVVFQSGSLLRALTVAENVALPLTQGAAADEDIERRVHVVLMELDVDRFAHLLPHELSPGIAARVEIARAIVRRPKLLLCDDLSGSLDRASLVELEELLHRLSRRFGMAILLFTHDATSALRVADRAVVLDAGRLVFVGPAAELPALAGSEPAVRRLLEGRDI
jgi:ABC-type transporter Mla maintaining outer membrane lipid asymmetry ATPase subunit MlaF